MSYTVSSGRVSSGITLYKDSMCVSSGGTAVVTTVNSGGRMYVSGGGTAFETVVNNSGFIYVSDGGMASGAAMNSGGRMYVVSGGTATAIVVNGSGYLFVMPNGTATDLRVNSQGIVRISSGGAVEAAVDNGVFHVAGGTANAVTVSGGGMLRISSGGTANDTAVNRDGGMGVSSGGTANRTVIISGYMYVSGGLACDTQVKDEGRAYLSSGGAMSETVVDSGGTFFVSGGTANDTIVTSGGSMTVDNCGTANDTVVTSGGCMTVDNCGTAKNTVVDSSGDLWVRPRGTAYYTIVNSGGYMAVSSRGTADSVTVSAGGGLTVLSGATVREIRENGGYVSIDPAATASFASNSFSGLVLTDWGSATLHSGTTANSVTVSDHGILEVHSGGVVGTIALSSGYLDLYGGGKVTGRLSLGSGAAVYAQSGSVIDFDVSVVAPGEAALVNDLAPIQGAPDYTVTVSATQAAGVYALADGASAFASTITVADESGAALGAISVGGILAGADRTYALSLAEGVLSLTVSGAAASLSAVLSVTADVTAPTNRDVTVTATFSGDTAIGQYSFDGSAWLTYATGVVMTENGKVYFRGLDAAGNASAVAEYTVDNIDRVAPDKPKPIADNVFETWAPVVVTAEFSSDSVVREYSLDGETWQSYTTGIEFTSNGKAYFRGLDAAGNCSEIAVHTVGNIVPAESIPVRVYSGGALVSKGTRMDDKILGGGEDDLLSVMSGGVVSATVVFAGGSVTVHSGGFAGFTTVRGYEALLSVLDGGVAEEIYVGGDEIYTGSNFAHWMSEYYEVGNCSVGIGGGGSAVYAVVGYGGTLSVASGGTASNVTEFGGYVRVEEGAEVAFDANVIESMTLLPYASASLHGGTVANRTTIDCTAAGVDEENGFSIPSPILDVFSGGIANETVVSADPYAGALRGHGYLRVYDGGSANATVLGYHGNLEVHSGGVAADTVVAGFDGDFAFVSVFEGGIANRTVVSDGRIQVFGGVLSDTVINDGRVCVYSGGTAVDTEINFLDNGGSDAPGEMIVDGGLASGTTVNFGYLAAESGGVLKDVTVAEYGRLVVSGGATLTGVVRVGDMTQDGYYYGYAFVYGTLDFDVSTVAPGNEILVDDLALLALDETSYTVTVSATQAAGVYVLAGNAANFAAAVTLTVGGETYENALTVGNSYTVGDVGYSLAVDGGDLTLTVAGGEISPLVVTTAEDVVDATDGVTSLREAVAYAKSLGGEQTITFNISGTDTLSSYMDIYLEGEVAVDGYNPATQTNISTQYGEIHVSGNASLSNFTQGNYSWTRNGGDIKAYGGFLTNITVAARGDFYASDGANATSTTVLSEGAFITDNTEIEDLSVAYGGLFVYSDGDTLSGTITISGAAAKYVKDGSCSTVLADADIILDVADWTPGGQMVFFGYDAPENISGQSVRNHYYNALLEDISSFSGTGTYTVSVKADQAFGTYKLAGNAASFDSAMSLTVGESTYANALTVGDTYTVGGRDYSLAIDDSTLTLTVAEGQLPPTPPPPSGAVETYKSGALVSAADIMTGKTLVRGGTEELMLVSSGGTANETVVNSGGSLCISSGGTANFATANNSGFVIVSNGGVAGSAVLNFRGRIMIQSGGTANDPVVNSSGFVFVMSGGTANGIRVTPSGIVRISGGGRADRTVDEGYFHVVGGTANDTIVNSGGGIYIYNGGAANETTVNQGGKMYISSGGKVTGPLNIADGAVVSALSGGIIDFDISAAAPGDAAPVNDLALIQGVPDYTVTVSATQAAGVYVLAGNAAGFAAAVTLTVGGEIYENALTVGGSYTVGDVGYSLAVDRGDLALTVAEGPLPPTPPPPSGAVETYGSGALVSAADIMTGKTLVRGGAEERMLVSSGGTANATVVNSGGSMRISGGTANATVVNSGGSLCISSGGTAGATVVNSGGTLLALGGGTIRDLTVGPDALAVLRGEAPRCSGATVEGGRLYFQNGAQGADVVVSAGSLCIHDNGYNNVPGSGARVSGAILIAGAIAVSAGGALADVRVSGGTVRVVGTGNYGAATVSGATFSGGTLELGAGAIGRSVEIGSEAGATVSGKLTIRNVAWNVAVSSGGSLCIPSGVTANSTTVVRGRMLVGGTAKDTVVNSGGLVVVSSGGRHTGTLTVGGGAIVSACAGSVIDFDVSTAAPGDAALIGNLAPVRGRPDYHVTVSATQAAGAYALAGNAAKFDSPVTLTVGDATYANALGVGRACTVGDVCYSLALNGGDLTLRVAESLPPDPSAGDPDDQLSEAGLLIRSVAGALDDPRDVDMYSFTVVADEKIILQTSENGDETIVDTYLRLFDASGRELAADDDGGANRYSRLSYTFRRGGDYYIGVSYYTNTGYDPLTGEKDRDGKVGGYQLSLVRNGYDDSDDQLSEATALAADADAAGEISYATDVDMYRFCVSDNTAKRFHVDSADGCEFSLRIFDAAGKELASGVSEVEYSFGKGGVYCIGVAGLRNRNYDPVNGGGDTGTSATGRYTLRHETEENIYDDPDDTLSEATALGSCITVTGALDAPTDVDLYKFSVSADEELTFTLSGAAGGADFDSYLRLFDASGRELAANDDGDDGSWSSLTCRFAAAGEVYLGVSSEGNRDYDPVTGGDDLAAETGDYTLTVRSRIIRTALLSSAKDLGAVTAAGPTVDNGAIAVPTQVDMYSFSVQAGDRLWMDVDNAPGSDLDSYLRLFDATGAQLAANDDAPAPGEPARTSESYLEYQFASAGKYYVAISSFGNHDYTVLTNDVLRSGESIGRYRLSLGLKIDNDDPDDTLSEATALAAGEVRSDVLDTATDVDMYEIALSAGDVLTASINLLGLQDSYLRLFDASGNELAANDDVGFGARTDARASEIVWQARESGSYYLGVSGYGNADYDPVDGGGDKTSGCTGKYSIKVTVEAAGPVVADDVYEDNDTKSKAAFLGAINGSRDFSDLTMNDSADWYKFDLTEKAGVESLIRLTSTDDAAKLSLYIYGPDGALAGFAADGRDGVSMAGFRKGEYHIRVAGDETDDYGLHFEVTAPPAAAVGEAENYVVLFSGGYDVGQNRPYYYDSIRRMYSIATEKYGVDPSHVYILYADGRDPGIDNPNGADSDLSFAEGSTVMPALGRNLRMVFSEIAAVADANDHFLFYSFDHGAEDFSGRDYLCGWRDMISDTDFAACASEIDAGYQTYIMAQCFSGGMIEDLSISTNMFAASASDNRSPSRSLVNKNGKIAGGFSLSVENALDAGVNNTEDLYEYMLATNAAAPLDNPQKRGDSFAIFATAADRSDPPRAYSAGTPGAAGNTGDHPDYTANKNGDRAPVVTSLAVYDSELYFTVDQAESGDTVVLTAGALDPDDGEDIAKVEFYWTDGSGKRRLLTVDNDGSDGWQCILDLDNGFRPGSGRISALAQNTFGSCSGFRDMEFSILEKNYLPEIVSISLDADGCYQGGVLTVSGVARDSDSNGIDGVRIYLDSDKDGLASYPDEYLGLAATDENGVWRYSVALAADTAPGSYTIFAEAVDSLNMLAGAAAGIDFMVSEAAVGGFTATSSSIQWKKTSSSPCIIEYSKDDFSSGLSFSVRGSAADVLNLPSGDYRIRARIADSEVWSETREITVAPSPTGARLLVSQEDGVGDLFFADAAGAWETGHAARHVGVGDWTGTNEIVELEGRNRLADIFAGSDDANVFLLTDAANGDALFVDDIYTAFPDGAEAQSRIARIDEIRAGAGDDVVDMTSQRFAYTGDGVTVRGGLGDDVIWANAGDNSLFGDSGNDRLVGASGNDVLAGGIGNDRMHGGGGNDVFTFGNGWGVDTVAQLADGSVTLWFAEGGADKWDAATLTYADGQNFVTVSGVTADKVTLKFGDDGTEEYATLAAAGAFADASSEKIFEEKGKGILATL